MKASLFFSIACLLLLTSTLHAQSSFWKSENAYLGQPQPGDTPRIFAQQLLLPDSGATQGRSAFSADGKTYFYSTALHWYNPSGTLLRYMYFDGTSWQGPKVLAAGFYTPTLSIDGRTLYLAGGPHDREHDVVWSTHRNDTGWLAPTPWITKTYGLYDLMPTREGTMYLGTNTSATLHDFQTYDISTLIVHDKDTLLQSLGAPINTPGFDGDLYIAPDASYLIVSNKETATYESELAISFHRRDGSWTAPLSLGPLINEGLAHRWGQYVSPDGKYLFFTKGTSVNDCHIYWVRFDALKKRLHTEAMAMAQ